GLEGPDHRGQARRFSCLPAGQQLCQNVTHGHTPPDRSNATACRRPERRPARCASAAATTTRPSTLPGLRNWSASTCLARARPSRLLSPCRAAGAEAGAGEEDDGGAVGSVSAADPGCAPAADDGAVEGADVGDEVAADGDVAEAGADAGADEAGAAPVPVPDP